MNDHNFSICCSISMKFSVARAIQDLHCDYVHSTCMVSLSRQKTAFLGNFVPGGVNRAKLGGWVGGADGGQ